MTIQPVIRPARAEDAPRLALVGSASFLESFAGLVDGGALIRHCQTQHTAPAYLHHMASGAKAWLAELDHAPVGYALLTAPELDAAQPGDIELKRIYVLSRFHGSGMAAQLLEHAIAAANGCERMLLGVKDDNGRAIAFYRKHGFEQVGTRRFDVGGAIYRDVVLARDLAEATAA